LICQQGLDDKYTQHPHQATGIPKENKVDKVFSS
jgi:hypothetical protein